MTSDEWETLTGMFEKVYQKIDDLPCPEHGKEIANIKGMRNGGNAVKREISQSQTLSLKRIGIVVGVIFALSKIVEIVIGKL